MGVGAVPRRFLDRAEEGGRKVAAQALGGPVGFSVPQAGQWSTTNASRRYSRAEEKTLPAERVGAPGDRISGA